MVKLSVSKAAKILGITRFEIQAQINNGKLHTHEGYVTTDSLRLAYPNIHFHSEEDRHIQKMQQIKDNAVFKSGATDTAQTASEKAFTGVIAGLKAKNQHYQMVFSQLNQRLEELEKCCHSQDKNALNQLQNWIKQQAN
ncbi:MAG: hypothetical protein HAW58_01425 [Candidatus Thioglobus sp.]|nr:hypothetical protein [Candidatus Thioglobus sp.]